MSDSTVCGMVQPQYSVLLRPTGVPGLFGLTITLSGPDVDYKAVMTDHAVLQNAISTVTGRKDLKVVEVVWITLWSSVPSLLHLFKVQFISPPDRISE